jgi:hypothetical protein
MRVGFIEHPHHLKTGSSNFFLKELTSRKFEITRINRDEFTLESAKDFDLLVLWQADQCIRIAIDSQKKTLVIPMLDEALSQKSRNFMSSSNLQYLSFSKSLHDFLVLSGCNSTYIQYWPEIQPAKQPFNEVLKVFFWERTPEHVSKYNVVNWFRNYDCNFVFRSHSDPGHIVSKSDVYVEEKRITHLPNEWLSQSGYLEILAASDVFVAPRRWEGIGLSTLEALSRGIPVVGLNSPTLSEYIISGDNGVLVDEKFKALEIFDFKNLSSSASERSLTGHKLYKIEIVSFFEEFLSTHKKSHRKFASIPRNLTLREFVYLVHRI